MACTHDSFVPGCPDCATAAAVTLVRPADGAFADSSPPATLPDRPSREDTNPRIEPTVITGRLPRGALVGRYVVLDSVGQGGMGRVYAAFDPELDRKVAIKLLHAHTSTSLDDARSRLVREAQAMARLSHPNVVPVHDVGVFGGSIFLAMEYVEGTTLHTWVREPRPWREALAVLIAAGSGLSAAHAAGLVHRDFKPANVLIGKDGRVRVTDFGLVRAMKDGPPEPDLRPPPPEEPLLGNPLPLDSQLTEVGMVVGTPGYMAPEQLTGEEVTPQSDQFAFCASCYQVLHGELPFEGRTLAEYSAAIMHERIRPPPAGSKVPGWVRRILLRGLARDPAARFPSMDALLDALARDPARAQRRRLAVGAVVAVVLAGVAAARLAGRAQSRLCTGAAQRLAGVWDAAAKERGERAFQASGKPFAAAAWTRASGELDHYSAAWTAMHREACEATRVRGEQPEPVLALRMACLDQRLKALGAVARLFGSADARVVEKALDAASALPRLDTCADVAALSQPVPPPADAAGRAKLEAAQQALADARALTETGQYKRAMEQVTPLTSLGPDPGLRVAEAEALLLKARLHQTLGTPAEAEEDMVAAAAAAEEARSDELKTRALSALVGLVGYGRGRYEEARRLARLTEAAITRADGNELLRAELATRLGDVEWRAGELETAVQRYEEALALQRRHHTRDHPDVAYLLYAIGWTLMDLGDLDRAAGMIGQALEMEERLYGEEHPKTLAVMNGMAALAHRRDDLATARALFERVLRATERVLGAEHPNYASALINLSQVLVSEERPEEALRLARESIRIVETRLGAEAPDLPDALGVMGSTLHELKRYPEALRTYQRALELAERTRPESETVSRVLDSMSRTLSELGRLEEAVAAARRALALRDKPDAGAQVARWLPSLARAYGAAGRHADAVKTAERMVRLREESKAPPTELAEARFELARAVWGDGRRAKERQRALQLADEARDAYVAANRPRLAREVERWMASRR